MKYKTKPIIVEARQFTLEAAAEMFEFEEWCKEETSFSRTVILYTNQALVYNNPSDMWKDVEIGDWVVMYEDHLEAVSDEDFKKLYEVVE